MDMQEIQRYIEVGSGYIEIDRSYPEKYQGLCRRIYIRRNEIQVDYISENWIETEEGEETFYFLYDNLESAVKYAENYIGKPLSEWINYNRTYNLWNFPQLKSNSWKNMYSDLQNHSLDFPKYFNKFWIRTYMAR
ncbi:MAG: hypothetical protein K2H19_07355, partial [Ruminococcus sp.]|nr:hypothetical protein [Ruminococcus sp.]